MSAGAVIMMLIAIAVIWGGLALAILNLNRNSADHAAADSRHRDL